MNVHKPPSIAAPSKIEDCLTSFIIIAAPGRKDVDKGMEVILRYEKNSPEMGGSGS